MFRLSWDWREEGEGRRAEEEEGRACKQPVRFFGFVFKFICFMCRKIFAFDTDSRRLSVMKKLMMTACVKCVAMKNMDFLKVLHYILIL